MLSMKARVRRMVGVVAVMLLVFASGLRITATGCGEYECTWYYYGGSDYTCVGEGEILNDGGWRAVCECESDGNCYFVPLD